MSRWANGANQTAAAANAVALVTLVDLHFGSGTLYLHDGAGNLQFNGNTYQGVGSYGTVDAVSEDLKNTAIPVLLTLSGVEPNLITSAMTENYQGKQVTIYVSPIDPNTLQWYAVPETVWDGRMDYMQIDIQDGQAVIKLYCENRLNKEPPVARYTDQDQQIGWPGDTFFNLLAMIPNASATWGSVDIFHPQNIPPTRNPYTSPVHRPPPATHQN